MDVRTVQLGMQLLNGMTDTAKASHQTELGNRLQAQLNDYENKFAALETR